MTRPNCPFYGFALFKSTASPVPFLLIATTGGRQCGLAFDKFAECFYPEGEVEWAECPRVMEVRLRDDR